MLVVRKYGGSCFRSLKSYNKIASLVSRAHIRGERMVLIVSAPYGLTDELYYRVEKLCKPNQVNTDYQREKDGLVTLGEQVSAHQLVLALVNCGLKARSFNAYQLGLRYSKNDYALNKIENQKIIHDCLHNDVVPVVTGFQGLSDDNHVTTLGRNSSDLTAVSLAYLLKADKCFLLKDVDGIYNLDPKSYLNAMRYKTADLQTVLKLVERGAKIIQDNAVKYLEKNYIKTYINHYKERGEGTLLIPHSVNSINSEWRQKQYNSEMIYGAV